MNNKASSLQKPIFLKNLLSNEIWICEDYNKVKVVDGVEFIEVYKPESPRKFLMNKASLTKIKGL